MSRRAPAPAALLRMMAPFVPATTLAFVLIATTTEVRATAFTVAGDVLARYGGEEFAVLLPARDLRHAKLIVDRPRAAMPAEQTCSAGIAEWDGRESPEAVIRRADEALYAAKAAGRDRTTVAA
jgi:diguanylate cyclase (GGDEF)-like protein